MLRPALILLFTSIFVAMLVLTIQASLDRSIFRVGPELLGDPWFQATLADAYFGFITFYLWVAYQQTSTLLRVLWLVLILALGNFAMSLYVLIQLWRWDPGQGIESLLLRSARQS